MEHTKKKKMKIAQHLSLALFRFPSTSFAMPIKLNCPSTALLCTLVCCLRFVTFHFGWSISKLQTHMSHTKRNHETNRKRFYFLLHVAYRFLLVYAALLLFVVVVGKFSLILANNDWREQMCCADAPTYVLRAPFGLCLTAKNKTKFYAILSGLWHWKSFSHFLVICECKLCSLR